MECSLELTHFRGPERCGLFAGMIAAGNIEVGIAGGVESMSHFEMTSALNPEKLSEHVFKNEKARNCLLPMGTTSDVRLSRPNERPISSTICV